LSGVATVDSHDYFAGLTESATKSDDDNAAARENLRRLEK
jgi:hypothetical protein